jgi:hypothetical protein
MEYCLSYTVLHVHRLRTLVCTFSVMHLLYLLHVSLAWAAVNIPSAMWLRYAVDASMLCVCAVFTGWVAVSCAHAEQAMQHATLYHDQSDHRRRGDVTPKQQVCIVCSYMYYAHIVVG